MSTPSLSGQNRRAAAADHRWLWLTLAAALIVMVLLDRPLIRGDGVAYLAWADSFVLDSDMQFDNQLDRLRPVNTYQLQWNDATQRLVNIFPFGVALLQTPFYALGHWFALNGWWDANPDYFHQMQGVWRPYSLWLMIGANGMGLATVGLSWRIARRWTTAPHATLVTLAIFLGTPLLYYLTISPLNSHSAGAFAFTLFLWLLVKLQAGEFQGRVSMWAAGAIGVVAGLMVLSRWQLLLVAAPAWPILLWPHDWRTGGWRRPLLATITAAIVCLPLPFSWSIMFGEPFVIPYDAVNDSRGAFLTLPRNVWGVLWQTLAHSPVIALALVGLAALWRTRRRLAIYAFGVIVLQIYVNGGVLDWWAGETYGMRRMSELFPLYVLLAAALFHWADAPLRQWRISGLRLVTLALIVYAVLYLIIFVNYTWTNNDGVFINHVPQMWRHFWTQPHRWQTTWAVWQTHLGPWAWGMPGP